LSRIGLAFEAGAGERPHPLRQGTAVTGRTRFKPGRTIKERETTAPRVTPLSLRSAIFRHSSDLGTTSAMRSSARWWVTQHRPLKYGWCDRRVRASIAWRSERWCNRSSPRAV